MSTLRERNRLRTRTEIADAALTLFEQHGYENTTVEQIALKAGVSSATFFRYFATKEDVMFSHEADEAVALAGAVGERSDSAHTLSALQAPIVAYAASFTTGSIPRRARLVMTMRTFEARGLRLRLQWEQAVAAQLASEHGRAQPELADTVLATLAVSCLISALRHWDYDINTLAPLITEAFRTGT